MLSTVSPCLNPFNPGTNLFNVRNCDVVAKAACARLSVSVDGVKSQGEAKKARTAFFFDPLLERGTGYCQSYEIYTVMEKVL